MTTGILDLTVNGWCDAIYQMQIDVEEYGPVDDISRGEYGALLLAVTDLQTIVRGKLTDYVATAPLGKP